MKRNAVWLARSTVRMLVVALLATACDTQQMLGPGSREQVPVAAVAGQVFSSATKQALSGARVEILGVGTAFTDAEGMYRLGNPVAVEGMSALALRVEAPGYAPITRVLQREHGILQVPTVHLTPLPEGTPLGPEGGEYVLANGVKLRVPAGAVERRVTVAVTTLPIGASGRLGEHLAIGSGGTFYVSPRGTKFRRPLRISIPLQEFAKPFSKVQLYTFDPSVRSWVPRGAGTADVSGLYADVLIEEGDTYAYTFDKNWDTRETQEPVFGFRQDEGIITKCLVPNEQVIVSGFTYNTQFATTVDPVMFPGVVASLYAANGGDRTVPGFTTDPSPWRMRLKIFREFNTEQHWEEAWLLNDPATKYPYEWHNETFGMWLVELWEPFCDD